MSLDKSRMGVALYQAKLALEEGELPFGAAIFPDKTSAFLSKDHSREIQLGSVAAHAELRVVEQACYQKGRDLSGAEIFATGEPCNMCAAAIFQAKIGRVVIAVSRADIPHILRPRSIDIEALAQDSSYTPEIVRGVLKEEAMALFDAVELQ